MPEFPVSVILNAINNTKTALNEVKSDVEEMSRGFSDLGNVVQGVVGILSTYAGTKGLMGMVDASVEANRMLVQSRFFLKGMGDDVESNISTLRKWGTEIQRDIGINDEFAVLVASRLAPRFKDLNKIQAYATTLLKGHRIGVLDAESASIMLMRAADGNARAMTWLAYQLGITVHEFESMDSIMAKIQARLEGLTDQLSPYDKAMAVLRERFQEFMEQAGTPLAQTFATILGWVLYLIDKYPVLGDIIQGGSVLMAGALTGLGFAFLFTKTEAGKFLATLGITSGVISGVVAAILLAVWYIDWMRDKTREAKEDMVPILMALAGIFALAFVIIHSAFFLPLAIAMSTLLVITQMSIESYELSWKGFTQFLGDTFIGLWLIIKEFGEKALKWLKETWENIKRDLIGGWSIITEWFQKNVVDWFSEKVDFVRRKFDEILSWVNRAKEAILGVPAMVGGAVGGVLGGRQFGGYIPETGPYLLHRGEYVVPAGRGGGITLTITGNTFLDEESAVRMGDLIIKVLQRNIKL